MCQTATQSRQLEKGLKYHNVFREEVVAEGAVIKIDFIKGLFGQLHHVTLVVAAVLVFTDHLLSHCQLIHGGLVSLSADIKSSKLHTFRLEGIIYLSS